VAITGASGAAYGARLLHLTVARGAEVDLVVSDWGRETLRRECDLEYDPDRAGGGLVAGEGAGRVRCHRVDDLGAPPATGSARWEGMCVIPCSMGTLGRIAAGTGDNLIVRSAEVALKERRRLVLVPRETPLSLLDLRNMTALAEAGAVILPAMPAFYDRPQQVADLVNFVAERALTLLGLGREKEA